MRKDENGSLCIEDIYDRAEDAFWCEFGDKRNMNNRHNIVRNFAAIVENLYNEMLTRYGESDEYTGKLRMIALNLFALSDVIRENPEDGESPFWKYNSFLGLVKQNG